MPVMSYGNLINRVIENTTSNKPTVGMGNTEFEYQILVLNSTCEISLVGANLDALGQNGWELVGPPSVVPCTDGSVDFWYHFKRYKASGFRGDPTVGG